MKESKLKENKFKKKVYPCALIKKSSWGTSINDSSIEAAFGSLLDGIVEDKIYAAYISVEVAIIDPDKTEEFGTLKEELKDEYVC